MGNPGPWQPLTRSRTYELVLDQIEEQILAGQLGVGDRLPPERDLATMLGVSRAAIREALRVLEAQGVLGRPQVGTGPESGSIIADLPSIGLSRLLRLHVALANFPLDDVVEARTTLERASARLAASNATPEHLAQLRHTLDQMAGPDLPRDPFNDLDTEFHVVLAEAAGNRLVADMTIALRNAMRHTLLQMFEAAEDWPATRSKLLGEHRGVYEAGAAGDGAAAADRVEAHIRGFYAPKEPPPDR
jgi:GntR family transcriptional repressor for pyruvate dehydrogenase complex